MTFCPTGWFGRCLLRTGAPREPYPPVEPDLVVDEAPVALTQYGIDGHVQASPGHTPGSLSVLLSDGSALVGDMLAGGILLGGIVRAGRAKPPPFEEDASMAAREIRRLAATGVQTFYLGHGGPVTVKEATRHADCVAPRG